MLTRRGFTAVAGCAICGLAGFSATEVSAQGAPVTAGGVTRKILSRTDGPAAGYESILMDVVIAPGAKIPRHTHPGIESSYMMEGELELPVQGRPTRTVKAGEGFQIPPYTPHAGGQASNAQARVMITYIVEKGKPLASPA
jgi:quercetin dioxygenase-like cupin family protein